MKQRKINWRRYSPTLGDLLMVAVVGDNGKPSLEAYLRSNERRTKKVKPQ